MDPKCPPPSSQVALSWARSIQSVLHPISWRSILIVYSHPHVCLLSVLFLLDLPIKTTVWIIIIIIIIIIIFVVIIIIIQIHYMQLRRWHPHGLLTFVVVSPLPLDYNFVRISYLFCLHYVPFASHTTSSGHKQYLLERQNYEASRYAVCVMLLSLLRHKLDECLSVHRRASSWFSRFISSSIVANIPRLTV